jgi:hypothetical protein
MDAQQLKAIYPIYPKMDFKILSENVVSGSTLVRKKFKETDKYHLIMVKAKSSSLASTKLELENASENNLKHATYIHPDSQAGKLGYSYPIDNNQND